MATSYRPLPVTPLPKGATYHRPRHHPPDHVSLDDPAIRAMTDLDQVYAVTITPETLVVDANQHMIANQVRLLLVVGAGANNSVIGLITATDVLGEKPLLCARAAGITRGEVTVGEIMTPTDQLKVMQLVDVAHARVGDIVASLEKSGRQHAVVIDIDHGTLRAAVRGIFSATQISRQLGIAVEPSTRATTFAEVEHALSS
ncbi:MAG: CBS domain-containing protein [Pseudomonadota bacterium]|nr:MAG: CBS domain-containing protein [Pseudomonadota bacterium]